MRSRPLAILVAVVVPLVALGVIVAQRGDSTHKPARLPILAGGAGGNATLGAARADAALYPYGNIVYKAGSNLPALDGSARAYKVSPSSESIRRVADAFGFNGIDPDANGTFTNGDEQLNVSPSGDWGYSRLSFDTGVSSGIAVACPTNADCPEPATTIPQHPADLPSQDDAKATALALLQRAGIDTEHATVTVDDFVTQWSVRVDPIVDGVPTEGLGSTVTIGEKSVIEYANGITGQPQTADEYPLIGTSAAIDRLNKGEGYIGPRPMRAQAATDTASGGASAGGSTGSAGVAVDAPPTPASPTPTKPGPLGTIPPCDGSSAATDGNAAGDAGSAPTVTCSPIDEQPPATIAPPPPQEITITGAERVLLFAPSFTGDIGFLVPAYRFTTSDGFGPTVLAIDDSFLQPPVDQVPTGKESIGSVGPGEPPAGVEPQPAPASDPPMTIEPGK